MAHHRARLSEVLTAVNASANHGVLMYVLRRAISSLDSDGMISWTSLLQKLRIRSTLTLHSYTVPTYCQEFVDALFGFVSYIASTQSGGNMIISAGILPVLIQLMTNKRADRLKVRLGASPTFDSDLMFFIYSP